MAQRPRILVTRKLPEAVETRMRELFDFTDDLAQADVLVPTIVDTVDAALIGSAGERLKLIANYGNGVDHIDLKAARARGIIVTNTPGVLTEDAADMAMALILAVARRLSEGERLVRSGTWSGWGPTTMLGHRVNGKALGILGMGRIGQAIAMRAQGFGLSIHYHNRRRLPDVVERAVGAVWHPELDDMLTEIDFLSINCPHNATTHHLIDAGRLELLGPRGYLINIARGEIVDEPALIDALENGGIAGAGLDVFEHEPAVDPRLLALDNVVMLPHMASATVEARQATGEKVIANIRMWADGHRPPDQVLEGWA
ncbi:D-glycerate dehydrogenase [Sphingomonas sp.]|jgi:glyoxylate reductase|uniref:2-hydroxyacid dehydrogenase n=1 Tax=Sphingomonas sp. TaxID=28214 RepID=UPI002DE37D70|nr:D-glycerate dehydrogenase [Sphingomonas sp.]